jgi:hypothetical protein
MESKRINKPDENYLAWLLPLKLEEYKTKIFSFLHSIRALFLLGNQLLAYSLQSARFLRVESATPGKRAYSPPRH